MSGNERRPRPTDYPPPFRLAWLAPRHWPTWLGMGLLWCLTFAPRQLRSTLGRAIGHLAYRRNHKRRAIVATNLRWCFPELGEAEREAMARDYFRLVAQSMLDYGLLWWGSERSLDRLVQIEGLEHLERLRETGRPVILMTGHTIGLDFGATALTRRILMAGMFKRLRNPILDWAVAHGRARFDGQLVPRESGVRPLLKALKQGYVVYHLPDEDLGAQNSLFVPFFGVPTATITGMGRMARIAGAAVIPYATIYHPEEGRYTARLLPPIPDYPSADDLADAAAMNRALEETIRLAPAQYMWSMRIFQTRPNGEPPPYTMKGKGTGGEGGT